MVERAPVSLVFAEMKDPVRAKIERYELTRTIDPHHFFPTLDAAVAEFVRETGATWRRPAAGSRPSHRPPKSSEDGGRRLASITALVDAALWVGHLALRGLHRWDVLLLSVASLGAAVV